MICDTSAVRDLPRPVAFTGGLLDRADHLRQDEAALEAMRAKGQGRLLRLDGIDPLLEEGALVWADLAEAEGAELVFLGLDAQGRGAFAAVPAPGHKATPTAWNLWAVLGAMAAPELATYGLARSVVGWHTRHRFCPCCGGATAMAKGGWQRSCVDAACGAHHFPRVDPVVIMSVEHDGDLLLGRQPRFPARRYSTLAGFVEPGEGLEEAVAREIREEAGLEVADVRFVASQPWPFPSSLMMACHARALSREIVMDETELEDARWFTRAQVAEAMAARERGEDGVAFSAPGRHAVAWHLLDRWLKEV